VSERLPPPDDGDERNADDGYDDESSRGPTPALLATLGVLLVALLGILGVVLLSDEEPEPVAEPSLTATPLSPPPSPTDAAATASASAAPSASATATPTDTATAPASETAEPEPTDRAPTDADAAAFATAYNADELGGSAESVAVDVQGDGVDEVVFASIAAGATRLDVAAWNGRQYEVVYRDQGGAAERVEDLSVADFTSDGVLEIVTQQASGDEGASLSVWGWNGSAYVRHTGVGGCWDGSNTYGIVGATIREGEIVATCDGSPLPVSAWPSDVYVWEPQPPAGTPQGDWTYDRTVEPDDA
jgi:hypothetical protein